MKFPLRRNHFRNFRSKQPNCLLTNLATLHTVSNNESTGPNMCTTSVATEKRPPLLQIPSPPAATRLSAQESERNILPGREFIAGPYCFPAPTHRIPTTEVGLE